tara:strand:- start:2282 stop:2539 length:258 start_codon:yes stop_codon:yes gene_type:complete
MKPIGKYIVIETIEEQLKTKSGLLLTATDANEFRYRKGKVVKPGTEVNEIKEHDIIYYDKSAGFSLLLNNITYTVITERDIVVVL